eukprot:325595-Pelagomonas_calceolata.AAC.1
MAGLALGARWVGCALFVLEGLLGARRELGVLKRQRPVPPVLVGCRSFEGEHSMLSIHADRGVELFIELGINEATYVGVVDAA